MSLNLTLECRKTGVTFDLWQTPTYITDMCLCSSYASTDDVAERYKIWVRSHKNGVCKDKEDLDDMLSSIQSHLEDLDKFLQNHPYAKFSYI